MDNSESHVAWNGINLELDSGELETVMGKVKKEKHYDYSHMLVMIIAALLPLLIGSSVGPEAGLTGIIVGLCYWAGENLKFAKQHTREYSQIGIRIFR